MAGRKGLALWECLTDEELPANARAKLLPFKTLVDQLRTAVERADNPLHGQLRRGPSEVQQHRGLKAHLRGVRARGADLEQPRRPVRRNQPEDVVVLGRQPLRFPRDPVALAGDFLRLYMRYADRGGHHPILGEPPVALPICPGFLS